MGQMGKTWSSVRAMAKDQQIWRDHVAAYVAARIFPRPYAARKNTTQRTKYPRVLYHVKPSNKVYVLQKT